MPGQIKKLIDSYVNQMSKNNSALAGIVRSKLALQGIIASKYNEKSPDDPVIINKIYDIAKQSNIKL
mgnify:CR=1 FL=1